MFRHWLHGNHHRIDLMTLRGNRLLIPLPAVQWTLLVMSRAIARMLSYVCNHSALASTYWRQPSSPAWPVAVYGLCWFGNEASSRRHSRRDSFYSSGSPWGMPPLAGKLCSTSTVAVEERRFGNAQADRGLWHDSLDSWRATADFSQPGRSCLSLGGGSAYRWSARTGAKVRRAIAARSGECGRAMTSWGSCFLGRRQQAAAPRPWKRRGTPLGFGQAVGSRSRPRRLSTAPVDRCSARRGRQYGDAELVIGYARLVMLENMTGVAELIWSR